MIEPAGFALRMLSDAARDFRRGGYGTAQTELSRIVHLCDSEPLRGLIRSLPPFEVVPWWDELRSRADASFAQKTSLSWPEETAARVLCRLEVCRGAVEATDGVLWLMYTWVRGFTGNYEHRVQLFANWVVDPMVVDLNHLFAPPEKPQQVHTVYNVIGHGARLLIDSHDESVNVIAVTPDDLFARLRDAIKDGVPNPADRATLLEKAEQLKAEHGRPAYGERYAEFIATAANHMTLIQPFLVPLFQLGQAAAL